jgi:hypothetical protein
VSSVKEPSWNVLGPWGWALKSAGENEEDSTDSRAGRAGEEREGVSLVPSGRLGESSDDLDLTNEARKDVVGARLTIRTPVW